jgi:hypothetical protein
MLPGRRSRPDSAIPGPTLVARAAAGAGALCQCLATAFSPVRAVALLVRLRDRRAAQIIAGPAKVALRQRLLEQPPVTTESCTELRLSRSGGWPTARRADDRTRHQPRRGRRMLLRAEVMPDLLQQGPNSTWFIINSGPLTEPRHRFRTHRRALSGGHSGHPGRQTRTSPRPPGYVVLSRRGRDRDCSSDRCWRDGSCCCLWILGFREEHGSDDRKR